MNAWLLFLLLGAEPVCSPAKLNVASETNSVLGYLEKALSVYKDEVLVERDIKLHGITALDKKTVMLGIRLPDTNEVIGRINLREGESYRGMEVVSIELGTTFRPAKVKFRSRDGKLVEINNGREDWVKVLVLGEKRDEYQEILSKFKNLTFEEYFNRVEKIKQSYLFISEETMQAVKTLRAKKSKNGFFDDRRILFLQNETDCATIDESKGWINIRGVSWDSWMMYPCKQENGDRGVCCNGNCKEIKTFNKDLSANPCGGAMKDECGRYNQLYIRSFNNTPCPTYSIDGNAVTGTCLDGRCQVCAQFKDLCKEADGVFSDGSCTYAPKREGAICDDGKVCVSGSCVDFSNIFSSSALKESPELKKIFAKSDNEIDTIKLDAALASISHGLGDCRNLNTPNGQTCDTPRFVDGKLQRRHCIDGECALCDSDSDLKLAGAPPCPPSITWPEKKGKRISCNDPDICIYE